MLIAHFCSPASQWSLICSHDTHWSPIRSHTSHRSLTALGRMLALLGCSAALIRSFSRLLTHSWTHWKLVHIYELNRSISFSFNFQPVPVPHLYNGFFLIFPIAENPCPEKGHILTIRLSEREEMVQPDSSKPATLMHVETYFQMNYETGMILSLNLVIIIWSTSPFRSAVDAL